MSAKRTQPATLRKQQHVTSLAFKKEFYTSQRAGEMLLFPSLFSILESPSCSFVTWDCNMLLSMTLWASICVQQCNGHAHSAVLQPTSLVGTCSCDDCFLSRLWDCWADIPLGRIPMGCIPFTTAPFLMRFMAAFISLITAAHVCFRAWEFLTCCQISCCIMLFTCRLWSRLFWLMLYRSQVTCTSLPEICDIILMFNTDYRLSCKFGAMVYNHTILKETSM